MPTTPRGYEYPNSGGHNRLWEHLQTLADDINTDVQAIADKTIGKPLCILRKSTDTSVANNGTILTWDIEEVDNYNMHSTSVNTSRVTPPIAGWYRLTACVAFANTNNLGRRGLNFRKNGTGIYSTLILATNVGTTATFGEYNFYANGTDYFELQAWQNSGSAVPTADTTGTFFKVTLEQ